MPKIVSKPEASSPQAAAPEQHRAAPSGPLEPEALSRMIEEDNGRERAAATGRGTPFDEAVVGTARTRPRFPAEGVPVSLYEVSVTAEVYAEPRSGASPMDKLYPGDRVRVAEFRSGWAKILSRAGRAGYMTASALGRPLG